tara:strand:- start:5925 stop:7892 length:1968 start_codon:yes stop_codon:yes gene_type:complete
MAVAGGKTTENGDAILISLAEPYKNVVEVISFSDVIEGESTDCFYTKSFRWGIDGVSYSDYATLTNSNLQALLLDTSNPFWIQYKYEQVGSCELEFKSISLEVTTADGVICKVPQVECCDSQTLTGAQNLVIDCCGSVWNPYDLSRAAQTYEALSAVASNIFGICAKYFKTAADQRSRDVILKEYSLLNVISSDEVKIMFPDNEFPTRELQFNPLMIDFPVQFEVHIVKSSFESVFGVGKKPEVGDYMYVEKYLNKMYEVDAVALPDDVFYTGSYWRVSLVPYQQRTSVLFDNKNIETERDEIISSIGISLDAERDNEFRDTRKENQYNTIGNLANDYVRRILDKKLIIKEENVYNNWTIISKYHYSLNTMIKGEEAVAYRYSKGWAVSESRAFSFWIRPKYKTPIGENVLITSIEDNGTTTKLNVTALPIIPNQLKVGDWVNVEGTQSYNSIHQITEIGSTFIIINTQYVDSVLLATPKFSREKSCAFLEYSDATQSYVELTYTSNWFIVKLNNEYYKFNLKSKSLALLKDNWYAVVININNLSRQLSLFMYKTVEETSSINPERTAELTHCFTETKSTTQVSVIDGNSWKLLGSDTDLTNIRIWKTPIEEEEQALILSQYVVNDTRQTLVVDNASPQLLIRKTSINRDILNVD